MSHPEYELLLDGKLLAKKKLSLSMDPVAQLPIELFCPIMGHLDCQTIAESVVVSKLWKTRLTSVKICQTKLATFRRLQVWFPSMTLHGRIWLTSHEDALVYYHQNLGLDFSSIASRMGRTESALKTRYKSICLSYGEAAENRRVPRPLALRQ
ncbi:hypothetical protein BDA99DRAFT_356564 [Phascolomyces articulosus]|uniref:F-box domain-containing protein n=1 Tax=Phascolomyces articulosus TaxID=60185 RepID=A0AAD5KIM4_9FUNG|nr:hypothetical protein BDA99DRAFT_356564 [Phascolomyces articulosus]